MKVIQATTFSFDTFDQYVLNGGESFSVSRFGYEYLKQYVGANQYQVVAPKNGRVVRFLTKMLGGEGRNLALQVKCALAANKVDLLYYPTDRHSWLLAILRKLRICRTPILMVSHFTFNTHNVDSKFKKNIIRFERFLIYHCVDRLVFASEHIMQLAREDYPVPERHRKFVGWGADLNFFSKKDKPYYADEYFLAAGGVNRDYRTLIEAFRRLDDHLIISCNPATLAPYGPLPDNITVFDYRSKGEKASMILRNLYQNCIAVLLPIERSNQVPNGASVLVESIACGKPLIVSDLNSNFVDIRKEGIGLTARMHNVDDWVACIKEMKTGGQYPTMVNNCVNLAKVYNYETFAKEIYAMMKDMAEKK